MFWHVDTEAVCFVILLVFYLHLRGSKDFEENHMRLFKIITLSTMSVIVIDVIASLAMDFTQSWWVYQITNNIYFATLPLLSMLWFIYVMAILGVKLAKLGTGIAAAVLGVFAALVFSNPWTGFMYSLTPELVYTRGVLFWVVVGLQIIYCAATILIVLMHRKSLSLNDTFVLAAAPVIEIFATYLHLLNSANGYLLMNAGYTIAYVIIYLNTQSRRQSTLEAVADEKREFSRFISYVYRANESVFEINLRDKLRIDYSIDKYQNVTSKTQRYTTYKLQGEMLHPDDVKEYNARLAPDALQHLIDTYGQDYFEARVKTENDDYRWCAYTLVALARDETHPANVLFFKQSIDEAKRSEERECEELKDALEAAKQASSAKGEFMSRMSHEIRTPLNAVIGYLDIASDESDDHDKVNDCIAKSQLAAKQLLSIINDVLDMSSIESGRMKLAKEPFNFQDIIASLATIFYTQASVKNIHFEVNMESLTEEWLVGDPLRINQILINLLSNAIKFTPENGSVRLDVRQAAIVDGKVHMEFKVSDTGIGISKEYLSQIFKPFEQGNTRDMRRKNADNNCHRLRLFRDSGRGEGGGRQRGA